MDDILHQARQLDSFRAAWPVLQDRVRVALNTQVGDVQRLSAVRAQALSLLESAEQVSYIIILLASNSL